MSNVKERIFGAVTIMSEEDAVKVWNLIQGAVALSNAEEVAPYPDELAAIAAYKAGDPDYQPSISQEDLMKELEKMMDAHLAQLSDTEKHVVDLSQQLEAKYDAFVAKLEATNMDQLYKYCQDMSKSINTKLGIALGGVAVAVIISIISLFI